MDRAEAAVHYLDHAAEALQVVLERCTRTLGALAAENVARAFIDILFRENLINYCELGEVYSLWGVLSRRQISDRVYFAEFVLSLNQQFNLVVEPAALTLNPSDRRVGYDDLTNLGKHLVVAIAVCHPQGTPPGADVHAEVSPYNTYMQDVPDANKVARILVTFPWMAPLYLLSFSVPERVLDILDSFVVKKPANEGANGAPGNE